MPTFAISVREKDKRATDGKYPVSIRITHNRDPRMIPTGVYVTRKQISADFSRIQDATVIVQLSKEIEKYEDLLLKGLGADLSQYSATDLKNYIMTQRETAGGKGIDFIAFCRGYIQALKDDGRDGYASPFESIINNLTDYFGRPVVYIKEINVKNLLGFAEYMQKTRTISRPNQMGGITKRTVPGVKPQTVKDYFTRIQIMFNATCNKYNDPDTEIIIISHNPFVGEKLQIDVKEKLAEEDDTDSEYNFEFEDNGEFEDDGEFEDENEPEEEAGVLTIDELVKILKAETVPGKRMQLARDACVLSFYLVAINSADLFGKDLKLAGRRIIYHRQKTRRGRKDNALMSCKIEPEAIPLMLKYRDPDKKRPFCFYKMYGNYKYFNTAINKGCKQLAKYLDINPDLTYYYMRHTLATIGSEYCGISEGDIALLLNHVGDGKSLEKGKNLKVTRGYIHRRFKKNDINQRKILDFVKSKCNEAE